MFAVVKRPMHARQRVGHSDTASHGKEQETNDKEDNGEETTSFEKDDEILARMKERAVSLGLPPLKVCVMSATLDVQLFQTFFPESAMVKVPGRQYPVQVVYTDEVHDVSLCLILGCVLLLSVLIMPKPLIMPTLFTLVYFL